MFDLFLRAETPAALRAFLRRPQARTLTGRIIAGAEFKRIAGRTDFKYFPVGNVSDGAGGADAWVWIHIRISGPASAADRTAPNNRLTDRDRWNKSRFVAWLRGRGVRKTVQGCEVWEYTVGTGKRVQVWRGDDMKQTGVLFHQFAGAALSG